MPDRLAPNRNHAGFTLIEISVVLVVVGLLVGGIVMGQQMIHNATLNSVLTDITKFKTGVQAFSLKYSGLPGDLTDAQSYWPNDSQYAGFTTANGNGDRRICPDSSSVAECNNAWEQLALAQMISGSYTGATSPVVGTSVPASQIPDAGYWIGHTAYAPGAIYPLQDGYIGNHLQLSNVYIGNMGGTVINAQDAKSIDAKGDDGKPHTGKIQGETGGPNFTGCKNVAGTDYLVSDLARECVMNFVM